MTDTVDFHSFTDTQFTFQEPPGLTLHPFSPSHPQLLKLHPLYSMADYWSNAFLLHCSCDKANTVLEKWKGPLYNYLDMNEILLLPYFLLNWFCFLMFVKRCLLDGQWSTGLYGWGLRPSVARSMDETRALANRFSLDRWGRLGGGFKIESRTDKRRWNKHTPHSSQKKLYTVLLLQHIILVMLQIKQVRIN